MNKNVIIRLNDSNGLQTSKEGIKINKIISSISPSNFIKLLSKADNKVNPRIAKINKITKNIHETLEVSPELFWFKSKGILLSTENCKVLDRNRVEVTLDREEYEGIMDGGHNTFAIATFLIEKLFGLKIKTWKDCKDYWDENYEAIVKEFESQKEKFKFSIPIEIISPNLEIGSLDEFYDNISEICSARNTNVELTETSKGNHVGFYDYLKELLDNKFSVIWKSGDKGIIKSEDIISLACLPLIFLKENDLLPKDTKNLNRISIYSQKSKCIDFFNSVMEHTEISDEVNGKHILKNSYVKSGLELVEDIIKFFDRLYVKFPELYNNTSPGFGRIGSVAKSDIEKPTLFRTQKTKVIYPPGFIYPLLSGLTSLIKVNHQDQKLEWEVNPMFIDLSKIKLDQYVDLIKLVHYDAQKVGKQEVFYRESKLIFEI